MKPNPSTPDIYQLRIVLRDISPLIWRRLLVRSDTTLAGCYRAIPRGLPRPAVGIDVAM